MLLRHLSYALSWFFMVQVETLATYPYAIKNQRKARNAPSRGHFIPKPLVGGFGCLELVLYGIRVLSQQHYDQDPTNQSKTSLELEQ